MKQVTEKVKATLHSYSWHNGVDPVIVEDAVAAKIWNCMWSVVEKQIIDGVANPLNNRIRIKIWKETHTKQIL